MYYFFFNDTATTEIYTLSLHDALPICLVLVEVDALGAGDERRDLVVHQVPGVGVEHRVAHEDVDALVPDERAEVDRKSTRLNSSHANISYAVFCLKKKTRSPSRCAPCR